MIKPNGEIVPPLKCATCPVSCGCSWGCIRGDDLSEIYELRLVLKETTAYLVAASSAYRKYASRHRSVGRATTDPFFTTRATDFDKAAARAFTLLTTGKHDE